MRPRYRWQANKYHCVYVHGLKDDKKPKLTYSICYKSFFLLKILSGTLVTPWQIKDYHCLCHDKVVD